MSRAAWTRVLAAVVVVLIAGVVLAVGESTEVRIESRNGKEVTVDVDGDVETVAVDDLAEGEERTFQVGDRTLRVRRVDDELEILHDGHHDGMHGPAKVWISSDGEHQETRRKKIVVINRSGDDEEVSSFAFSHGDDAETVDIEELLERARAGDLGDLEIELEDVPHVMVWRDEGAHLPFIVTGGDEARGLVRYRCQETGSVLLVPQEDALLDTYICPATGCVMERVDEHDVKVFAITTEINGNDEED